MCAAKLSEHVEIRIIRTSDTEKVLHFLRRFYFTDEPLNEAAGVLVGGKASPDLEKDAVHEINHDVSLMKVNESGEILAVLLNSVIHQGYPPLDENCENKNFLKIVKFLNYTDKECDIFRKYPKRNKYILHKMYCVDRAWRGGGIGEDLLTKSRQIAKTIGIGFLRMDTTNFYCSKVAEKMGFACIYTLKYKDYQLDGVPVFSPKSPHTEFKIYALELDDSN